MNLPRRVAELAEEAERLQAQYLPQTSPEQQQPQQAPETPTGEAPVADQGQPPAQAPEVSTPAASAVDEPTWEQRFKTVQGKYDAEVPRYAAELRDLKSRLAIALSEIDRLKVAKAEPPKAAPQKLVTEKDVEAFGSDLIDVIDRKAREVAETMVSTRVGQLEAENAQLKEQLGGVTERQVSQDRRAYFSELGHLVPDYEALNVDPGFMGWLAEVDPLSGFAKQEYLTKAWNEYDAKRTAALFNAYKQLTAPPPPPTQPSQAKQQLQRQVAPGTSKVSSSAPQSAAGKVWATSEIDGFYRDVRRGMYYGKDDERARIEAEIDQAVIDGRIR